MRILSVYCYIILILYSTHAYTQAQITDMRLHTFSTNGQPAETLRLEIDLNAPAQPTLFTLKSPHRLVIDLKETQQYRRPVQIPTGQTLLTSIRSAPRDNNELRIVLDLTAPVTKKSLTKGNNGHRLIIDIKGPGLTPTKITQPEKTVLAPLPPKPPIKIEEKQVPSPPKLPVKIEEKIEEEIEPERKLPEPEKIEPLKIYQPILTSTRDIVVALDAGHGGIDPGAIGQAGVQEKDIVLAITEDVASLLKQEQGIRPVLIRKGDYFLSLNKRVELARKYKADLLISIHADAYPDKTVRGSSVYMLSRRSASSSAAKWLATRENNADLIGGINLNDKDELLASVLLDLTQTNTLTASAHIGQQILTSLQKINKTHYKYLQRAGFIVLRAPDVPSVLVEVGFVSNQQEELELNDTLYRLRIAHAIATGIKNYVTENASLETLIARR